MKQLIIVALILSTGLFCSCSRIPYITLQLDTPNPMCYEYNYSKDSVWAAINWCFVFKSGEMKEQLRSYYFTTHRRRYVKDPLPAEDSLMFSYHSPPSLIYRHKKTGEGLRRMNGSYYQLHVDSISPNRTKVCVYSHNNSVIVGSRFGPTIFGLMRPMELYHPATSIEEYEILQEIGKKLGEKGMPPIRYPKELTKKHIKEFEGSKYR